MKAEFPARCHIFAENIEKLHEQIEQLSQMTDDHHCLDAVTAALADINRAALHLNFAARRSAAMIIQEEREQRELIDRLEKSIAQFRCAEVAAD